MSESPQPPPAPPSYERHREHLFADLERRKGADYVRANRRLLMRAVAYLDRQGKLLTDEEFEQARREGRELTEL